MKWAKEYQTLIREELKNPHLCTKQADYFKREWRELEGLPVDNWPKGCDDICNGENVSCNKYTKMNGCYE